MTSERIPLVSDQKQKRKKRLQKRKVDRRTKEVDDDNEEGSLASNESGESENLESFMRSSIKESTHKEYDNCCTKFISWLNNTIYDEENHVTYGSAFINNGVISDNLPEVAVLNFFK